MLISSFISEIPGVVEGRPELPPEMYSEAFHKWKAEFEEKKRQKQLLQEKEGH